MSSNTISMNSTNTVHLGSAQYPNPLTITSTGLIAPTAIGADGVDLATATLGATGTLVNDGLIFGGPGAPLVNNTPTYSGAGVVLSGSLVNNGGIYGGDGPSRGGTGVNFFNIYDVGYAVNHGQIIGGSPTSSFANGGLGVDLDGGSMTNFGVIGGGDATSGFSNTTAGNGVKISSGTLTNDGLITGGIGNFSSYYGGVGAYLEGGTLINGPSGTVTGGPGAYGGAVGGDGVVFGGPFDASATLINQGTIFGGDAGTRPAAYAHGADGAPGVQMAGYNFDVVSYGLIEGGWGGFAAYGGNGGAGANIRQGTLINHGTILGGSGSPSKAPSNQAGSAGSGGIGIYIEEHSIADRPVTIQNFGVIAGGNGETGGVGVILGLPAHYNAGEDIGTFVNGGTISGGYSTGSSSIPHSIADALDFGDQIATLVVDPGAEFIGKVVANPTLADILEFGAGPTAGMQGTFAGIGTQVLNFNTFSFGSGASFDVAGTYTAFDSGQIINGFTVHDSLVLDGLSVTDDTYVSGSELDLVGVNKDGITILSTVSLSGNFITPDFNFVDSGANTTISLGGAPCFLAGTRILTSRGEERVESLRKGDHALLEDGSTAPITWIGYRYVDCARHPLPEAVLPVLVSAGAIGDQVPIRDLYLSPDHALHLDGRLIPVKTLINGRTIRQVLRRSITYYHVELPEHAVLLADGAPCESYLETGNRGAFENGDTPLQLHPQFEPAANWQAVREASSCAPFAESGCAVEEVRRRILARAGMTLTNKPELTIDRRPDGSVIIKSRSGIPGHVTPDPCDRRRLGVKVRTLRIGGEIVELNHPALQIGWHDLEHDGRWTNGAALIPATLVYHRKVTVELAATMTYPLDDDTRMGGGQGALRIG